MRSTAWGMVIGVAVVAAAGCGGSTDTTPTLTTTSTSTSTNTTTTVAAAPPAQQARSVKWVDLQAGDCLADSPPSDPAVVMVSVVDCAGPHLAEAYIRAPIPVNAALDDVAMRECATGFAHYTGATPAAGAYTTTYLIDSDQDRTSDNPYPSTVICLLQAANGQALTGSAHR
ncbi:hypothetical protein [Mycolicibacterium sp. P1-5]|uniref:hypothetical protein n=1 Tax=Mycolicibacterium sp. P1-5 TaxID=2024617 RepID=UPI001D148025|nr:hypothetical protein [Mycolicibacterium sp. P1-5]